jgi:hypothetical protein
MPEKIAEPFAFRRAVIALEGMPGFGKTSTLVALARRFGGCCLALSEMNLGGPNSPGQCREARIGIRSSKCGELGSTS